jgi:hypothetical protein
MNNELAMPVAVFALVAINVSASARASLRAVVSDRPVPIVAPAASPKADATAEEAARASVTAAEVELIG